MREYIKIFLACVLMGFSIYNCILLNIGYGIMLFLLSALISFLVYRNEYIILTLFQLRQQNLDKAERYINKILKPDTLFFKTHRAYFFYIKGLLTVQKQGAKAESYFVKSLELGLKKNLDKAIVKLNLAGIYASRRQMTRSNQFLAEAKKLDVKGYLKDQIQMFKEQIKKGQSMQNRQRVRHM